MNRKTKIICTIGPASENKETLKALIESGMNVMRLNFSHGDFEEHSKRIMLLRELNLELGTNVGIMLDTKGPEIRTHEFEDGQAIISANQEVRVSMKEVLGSSSIFSVSYPNLINEMDIGDRILVDDGKLCLVVIGKEEDTLVTVAKNGAVLKGRRGINIPNKEIKMPYMTEKDKNDIIFACTQGLDYVAASFVRKAKDVLEIRNILDSNGGKHIQIIAKIENQEGVNNTDEILDVSNGIMVARGDLGVEVDAECVPIIQKRLIRHANRAGKVVITATQMLESMIGSPVPTRAEVSDVANAILDGSDAIMLSGESAMGKYPIEAVVTMTNIAKATEEILDYQLFKDRAVRNSGKTTSDAIASSVTDISLQYDISSIVAYSSTGFTARIISKYRPKSEIIVITPNRQLARGLSMNWGIYPEVVEEMEQFDVDSTDLANRVVKKKGHEVGETYILTGGYPKGEGKTTYMRIVNID